MLNNCIRFLENIPTIRLRWFIGAAATLMAMQICYIQHGWINNDTVLYLEAARLFSEHQWKAGFDLFPWPFYSLLIASLHQLTGSDFHFSAQILNVLFFALTTYYLMRLITLAGGNNVALASGALILFSSHYIVGDVMEMLMRDQGFWAFFLASLVFLIQYSQFHRLKDALLWQACIILATLFRIEGITYLIALPWLLLLHPSEQTLIRLKRALIAQTIPLATIVALGFVFQLNPQLQMEHLGRLKEVFTPELFNQVTALFQQRSHIMAEEVLGSFLDDYAVMSLVLTLIVIIVHKIISATGVINIGLTAFSIYRNTAQAQRHAFIVLTGALLVGVIDAQLIILKVFILSSRYIVPLILIFMVFAALGLSQLTQERNCTRYKMWLLGLIIIIMILGVINNLRPKADGYNFQQDAIAWLADKNTPHEAIYYHDARLRHYAGAPFAGTWQNRWERLDSLVATSEINHYRFLVLQVDPDDSEQLAQLKRALPIFKEAARFNSRKKNKYVLILENSSFVTRPHAKTR